MKLISIATLLSAAMSPSVSNAFSINEGSHRVAPGSTTSASRFLSNAVNAERNSRMQMQGSVSGDDLPLSEAEKLLERARALRRQAGQAERDVHDKLIEKKVHRDEETDHLIDYYFIQNDQELLKRLRDKRPSIDALYRIVDRLYERECIASGKDHVRVAKLQSGGGDDSMPFERSTAVVNQDELNRLDGCVDALVEALQVLDDEYQMEQLKANVHEPYVMHSHQEHYSTGTAAKRINQHYHEMKRQNDDQYKKRQQQLVDAQTIGKKKDVESKE